MSKEKTLFDNKWVTVKEKTLDNGGKYVYTTAPWCNSEGVAILPFMATEGGFKFLVRKEFYPAHSDELEMGSIMGGMDKSGESSYKTVKRELVEEAGVQVDEKRIIELGFAKPSKSSDNVMYLFAVDLTQGWIQVDASGDGTLVEEGGHCVWVTLDELIDLEEPLLHTMLVRATSRGLFENYMGI
jgi:8-oxo-dGTP pyrophosphatase MutT (NUDIX family)